MKIAVISDIHGNRQALEAVLNDIAPRDCVKVLCCGDLVGYGGEPNACIEMIRSRNIPCVRGNHDDLMVHSERMGKLRAEIRASVRWTRNQLSSAAKEWLGNLPFQHEYAGIQILHASHVFHPPWPYIVNLRSASANFLFQKAKLAFHGHTHVPVLCMHSRGSTPKVIHFQNLILPPHSKCLLNVGSVGQPRDRDPRASYVIFDSKTREVSLQKVSYDIEAAADAIRQAGLPERFATRLQEGR